MTAIANMPTASPGTALDPAELAQQAEAAAALLKALANPRRLLLLCMLTEGELSVGALNARIPLSQSALSQHLAVLRADGLVETRRESQTIFYRVAAGPALDVLRVLYAHYCAPPESDSEQRGETRR